jgi:hypothetical protein
MRLVDDEDRAETILGAQSGNLVADLAEHGGTTSLRRKPELPGDRLVEVHDVAGRHRHVQDAIETGVEPATRWRQVVVLPDPLSPVTRPMPRMSTRWRKRAPSSASDADSKSSSAVRIAGVFSHGHGRAVERHREDASDEHHRAADGEEGAPGPDTRSGRRILLAARGDDAVSDRRGSGGARAHTRS